VAVKALGAVVLLLLLVVVLPFGAGCWDKEESAGEKPSGVERPRLEAWALPLVDGPELLSNDVQAIFSDSAGILWFGTADGISRYNPKSGAFQTFTKKDGLPLKSVSAIAEDGNGALWFGTLGGGVSRYDPKSGAFQTFTRKDGLASDSVRAIAVDGRGALWFATDDGGSRYDLKSRSWKSVPKKEGLSDNYALTSAVYSNGVLWFGSLGGGVSRHDLQSGTWKTFTKKDGLAGDNVLAIAAAGHPSDAIWFGTRDGVSRYDPKSETWDTFTKKKDRLVNDNVSAIAVDRSGALWFGTPDGASVYDPKGGSWSTVTKKTGLADDAVRGIAVEEKGALWFGTYRSGVSRYDPESRSWKTFVKKKDGVADHGVQAIVAGPNNTLWFGTTAGVSSYDPKDGRWKTFPRDDDLADDNVQAIFADADRSLWFGTRGGGVRRYDSKSGFWSTFNQKSGLADNNVQAIFADADGALWFGTYSGGVSRYDPKSKSWSTFTKREGRLVSDNVQAITADVTGALWFGTGDAGVSRHDPKSGSWTIFTKKDGFEYHNVQAISRRSNDDNELWFGALGGVSRYDVRGDTWKTFTRTDGLAYYEVHAIAAGPNGELWFGASGGASRYDPKSSSWKTFTDTNSLGFSDRKVRAIWAKDGGVVWFGTDQGASRLILASTTGEAGALLTTAPPRPRIAAPPGALVVTRPGGLSWVDLHRSPPLTALPSFPDGADVTALAPGPSGDLWVGTALSGLTLRRSAGGALQLTRDLGLPSMTVTALAPVAGTNNSKVWVGTSAGVALARVEKDELRVEPAVEWDGMPTGPVDALAAAPDQSVFVAYNAISKDRFLDPELAERRSRTRVFHVPLQGSPKEIRADEVFGRSEVRALAVSAKHDLWAGTSAGLLIAKNAGKADAGEGDQGAFGFEWEAGQGRLHTGAIRLLAIAPDSAGTVWMGVDRQGDKPPRIVGYRPGTDWISELTQELDVFRGDAIDDMTFTEDGHLVVLAGSALAKGRVFVPGAPPPAQPSLLFWAIFLPIVLLVTVAVGLATLVIIFRRNLYNRIYLPDLDLAAIPSTLRTLRRFRALEKNWSYLGLPTTRISLLETLASKASPGAPQLRALAELLGMENAVTAAVELFSHGLSLLSARLPYPVPLRGHPVALIALDLPEAKNAEPARVRTALQAALDKAGQRFELPFLLLASGEVSGDLLPPETDLRSFRLSEQELKALLFARDPEHTFAGLLHARRLLALSPYTTAGEVKDEQMFFGRVALLKELLLASSIQQIVIGPRRVGKTSLLKRLLRELHAHRPEVEAVFVDLFGIAEHGRAARALARALKVDNVDLSDSAEPETAFVEIIHARFQDTGKKVVVLVDEADGLIEVDAQKGFPLLSAMRSLQAEEVCSFVLAGYRYLYREALNQGSPLYNFATPRILGPLDPEAATDLARAPMQSLGVAYGAAGLPRRIAARTGGYPSFVQSLCDAALEALREVGTFDDLTLTAAHLEQAEQKVAGELRDIFLSNVEEKAQSMVFRLLERDDFSAADAQQELSRAQGSVASQKIVEQVLRELRLFGFVVEKDGRFTWAIPLLRDTLRAMGLSLEPAPTPRPPEG
jgi:ligand-binding sensor domain-containing protein